MARNLVQEMMNETVEMPGFPQILVNRGWLYQFLKGCGWNESERGYASLDYTVFNRNAVNSSITLEEVRDQLLAPIIDAWQR